MYAELDVSCILNTTFLSQVHDDWVYKVKYCPTMEYLMSCSGSSSSSLYRVDVRGRKEGSLFKVRKGVATFDYSKDWNIIGEGIDHCMQDCVGVSVMIKLISTCSYWRIGQSSEDLESICHIKTNCCKQLASMGFSSSVQY